MILVTGGTGFVGRHLVRELCGGGSAVRVLTRDAARARSQLGNGPDVVAGHRPEVVDGDVLDPVSLEAALLNVDVVVHLAAVVPGPGVAAPGRVSDVNVRGTAHLAAAAARAGVRRFVHGSSAGVYGDGSTDAPHREDSPLRPGSEYERSKVEAEDVARGALGAAGVELVLLRAAGVYGPGRAATLAFYRQILRRRIWLHGPSKVLVHPVYIADVVQALAAAVSVADAAGRTFNIAGERALPFRELIDLTARLLGVGARQMAVPSWMGRAVATVGGAAYRLPGRAAPGWIARLGAPVVNRSLDTSLARQVLGFRPAELETSTRDTIAWFRRERLL